MRGRATDSVYRSNPAAGRTLKRDRTVLCPRRHVLRDLAGQRGRHVLQGAEDELQPRHHDHRRHHRGDQRHDAGATRQRVAALCGPGLQCRRLLGVHERRQRYPDRPARADPMRSMGMDIQTSSPTMGRVPKWLCGLLLVLGGAVHAGTVTYVYTDPQGTPLAEADANGTITATFDYAPYGSQALGSPPNGPGYTGHVNDPDTGLVYMQARYYDPQVGRFVSTDPVGPSAGNAFNFNRFAYANNNPIVNMDADGRMTGRLTNPNEGGVAGPGYTILVNPGNGAGGGHSPSPPRENVIISSVGEAAERDANKALEGVPNVSNSADTLVRGWASAVQPIADKYDTEIASKIFKVSGGKYKFGPAMSSGVICSISSLCSVNVWNAANIPGVLSGYTHAHPNNFGLSAGDLYTLIQMRKFNGLMGAVSVYASQPDGHIRKWSTDALEVPHSTNWTWRDYAEHAETLP